MRYLDQRYADASIAAGSLEVAGGARADSVGYPVDIHNGRLILGHAREQFAASGFTLATLTQEERALLSDVDCWAMQEDQPSLRQYYSALEKAVLRISGASYARATNVVLRQSSIVGVHTRARGDLRARGPVNDIHCDFAPGAEAITLMKGKSSRLGLEGCRFSVINCWKSISTSGPVAQWPMALCDSSTVNAAADLVPRISPENGNTIYNVLPSSTHRWYTYPAMTPSEVLMFKQYDTVAGTVPVPHTAFDAPRAQHDVPVRESCEVRVMCFFVDDFEHDAAHDSALRKLHAAGAGVVAPDIVKRWNTNANAASKL